MAGAKAGRQHCILVRKQRGVSKCLSPPPIPGLQTGAVAFTALLSLDKPLSHPRGLFIRGQQILSTEL